MCNNFNNCDLILPRGIVPDAENRITVNFNGNQISICANSDYAREEWIRQVTNHRLWYYSNPYTGASHLYQFDSNGNLINLDDNNRVWYEFRNARVCEAVDYMNNTNLGVSLVGIYHSSLPMELPIEWISIIIHNNNNSYGIAYRNANLIIGNRDREPNENEWDNRFWRFWGCEFIEYINNNS